VNSWGSSDEADVLGDSIGDGDGIGDGDDGIGDGGDGIGDGGPDGILSSYAGWRKRIMNSDSCIL
jgi:hypothetical protein